MNKNCQYCGSTNLILGVKMGLNADSANMGPKYQRFSIMFQCEEMLADICKECGTVKRLWIKETDRNWIQVE